MFKINCVIMSFLFSLGAYADVSFKEKQNRVNYLEELSKAEAPLNIAAYRRELVYEKQGLSIEDRADNEANLLAETVRNQVVKAYEASLNAHGDPNQANAEIRSAIEKDLELVDPSLQDELRKLSFDTLDDIHLGKSSRKFDLANVKRILMKGVKDRMSFLNKKAEDDSLINGMEVPMHPSVNQDRDAERKNYNTKSEIMSSLVSDRESIRWINASSVSLKSSVLSLKETDISLQVKVEFLGAEVEAGPMISFRREYKTNIDIVAEGLHPVILADGNFDFYVRDENNKIVILGGKERKRIVHFTCESKLEFETEIAGAGGISMGGIGAKKTVSKHFFHAVHLNSRRIAVPEYIDGKSMTYESLTKLCHDDFLKAKITNNMTVSSSLNMMMENVVSSLRFSHPKTKCATDNHCVNWYNQEVLALMRLQNYPRCAEESREKYYACTLRGLKGQNCAVYDDAGKRISNGMFEFVCDKGLKCEQYKEAGWFKGFELYQYAQGRCVPVNPKTYRDPRTRTIMVDLI